MAALTTHRRTPRRQPTNRVESRGAAKLTGILTNSPLKNFDTRRFEFRRLSPQPTLDFPYERILARRSDGMGVCRRFAGAAA